MGCGTSKNTVVELSRTAEDEDETGSKCGSRGDSAVSKGTTDSGVVMENRDIPRLPGVVPRTLPPQTFVCVGDVVQDGGLGLLQEGTSPERPKSSEILEELLNQGIIPVGQIREAGKGARDTYDITLDDREGVRRRLPARLEALKAQKMKHLPSREEIEEKMRLAEERRKLRNDELKTRLREHSARLRRPALTSSTVDEDITPIELLQSPLTFEAAEGGEWVREAGVDDRESEVEMGSGDKTEGTDVGGASDDNIGEERAGTKRISEDGDEEEELTQVEQLKTGQVLSASGELEFDSSFPLSEDK